MKFLVIFALFLTSCFADDISNQTSAGKEEGTVEDIILEFEEMAEKTKKAIEESTKEVIELATGPISKALTETQKTVENILKDGEEVVMKLNATKIKLHEDFEACKNKFIGQDSSLQQLLNRSKELEDLTKEMKNCPTDDISGMGCTLSKLMRGEGFVEEIENFIKKQKEGHAKIAEHLIESIGSCCKVALETAKKNMNQLLKDLKQCDKKDEL